MRLTSAARTVQVGALVLAMSVAAAAHDADNPTPSNWTQAWSWEPGVVIPLAISAVLYGFGFLQILRRNSRSPAVTRWQATAFFAGWLTLFIALDSPVHKLGEVLFSVHMSQHELLMIIAAPLLVMGRPLIAFLFALPEAARLTVGGWSKAPAIHGAWAWLTAPLTVWMMHGATIWGWHVPLFYQATLDNEVVHALQHLMFLTTALLFWYTLVHGRYGKMGYGVAFVYIFTTAVHTSILGALMTFAQQVWYPIYQGRTTPWHLTTMQDQQLGGLIMWIPSGLVFLVVGLGMLAAWLGESERRGRFSRLEQAKPLAGDSDV